MKRFVLAIALACALSGTALAGDFPSTGAPAPAPGDIPSTGAPATNGITQCPGIATTVILAILRLVR